MRRTLSSCFLLLSVFAIAAGCGGSGSSETSAGGGGSGNAGGGSTAGTGGAGGGTTAGSGGTGGGSTAGSTAGTGGAGGGTTAGIGGAGGSTAGTGGAGGSSTAGSGGIGGAGGGGGTGGTGGMPVKPPVSPFIVADQFGYPPAAQKIAVARDPEVGFDAAASFTPGATWTLVNASTGQPVFTGTAVPWSNGATDSSSGDRAFWFDFSSVQTPGLYYVHDVAQDVRSYEFRIATDVYREVLKHAVRSFFYQRAGQQKLAQHAGQGWADGASHLGALQDANCRRYNAVNDPGTERDLRGGWYDAGDYNKYTSWAARYVLTLLHAYEENPSAFTDDYGIPESQNGAPDVLDEAKWGMDWLIRMQSSNGSVLSIVGVDHDSPPSAATGQSRYGTASTSATLATAAAFAYGSKVFRSLGLPAFTAYADQLVMRAEQAWAWANANPNVLFYNNDSNYGTQGLGAGQQETDDYGRLSRKVEAAAYLFEVTGTSSYRTFFDQSYNQIHLMQWTFAYPFEVEQQEALLYYTKVPGATAAVVNAIRSTYNTAMQGASNFGAITGEADPYRAYIQDYVWGSNSTKSNQGNMFYDIITFGVNSGLNMQAEQAAARYIHYIHGTNPLSLVYLSNMYAYGAENTVNEFYHSWFTDGSALWDRAGVSTYGPAPGFLAGGPNPGYDWDGCCPNGCGSSQANAVCVSESISPPKGQPKQKAYKDFNTNWPLNSWAVTENSNGYQVAYIRLLSKLVK